MVALKNKKENVFESSTETNPSPSSNGKSRLSILKRSAKKPKAANMSSNDPFRFQGSGIDFKGKLIGSTIVQEARREEVCSDAMKLVKDVIKASGTHKQRIILNVSIDGLKLRDERSSNGIRDFNVSKISYVARDSTDPRAFGFIVGNDEGRYKFYGIKTAQNSELVVAAIRDMFQVVFEMKNKQIGVVKQGTAEDSLQASADDDTLRVETLIDLESEYHQRVPRLTGQPQQLQHLLYGPGVHHSFPYYDGHYYRQPIPQQLSMSLPQTFASPQLQTFSSPQPQAFSTSQPSPYAHPSIMHRPLQLSMNSSSQSGNGSMLNSSMPKSDERKRNIDDLFNELTFDTNVLMQKVPADDGKKNPFEHLINPPKPSIVSMASQRAGSPPNADGIPPGVQKPQHGLSTRMDPMNDDRFNKSINGF